MIVSNNSKYSFRDTDQEKEHIRKVEPRSDIFGETWNPRSGILIVGPKTRDTYDTWDTRPETCNPYNKWDLIARTLIFSQTWDQKELWSKWCIIEYHRNRISVMNLSDIQSYCKTTVVNLANYIVSFSIATSLILKHIHFLRKHLYL